jgi:hypothetical protein
MADAAFLLSFTISEFVIADIFASPDHSSAVDLEPALAAILASWS